MKKSNIKLSLNKKSISSLEIDATKGGITGWTCNFTNRYHRTCFLPCVASAMKHCDFEHM